MEILQNALSYTRNTHKKRRLTVPLSPHTYKYYKLFSFIEEIK
jgi:hypothetical protein